MVAGASVAVVAVAVSFSCLCFGRSVCRGIGQDAMEPASALLWARY